MAQASFAELEHDLKKRRTRRELFLEKMDKLVPWERLERRIEPFYPKAGRGRRPYPLSVMLRVHCVQLAVLAALPRSTANPWVLPGRKPGTHLSDIDGAWDAIRNRAGLVDVRMHDLRHSFASRALALGQSLPMIGKLLGHRQIETTGRYAHLARESMHEAATRVSESIAARIL